MQRLAWRPASTRLPGPSQSAAGIVHGHGPRYGAPHQVRLLGTVTPRKQRAKPWGASWFDSFVDPTTQAPESGDKAWRKPKPRRVFGRHKLQPVKYDRPPKRAMRHRFPLPEITPLTLDLDDESCPIVRPLDMGMDGDDVEPMHAEQKRLVATLKERYLAFDKHDRHRRRRALGTSKNPLSPWHISDLDLVVFALNTHHSAPVPTTWCPPSTRDLSGADLYGSLLDHNGIEASACATGNTADLIPYLVHRQAGATTLLPADVSTQFWERSESLSSLSDLERVVPRLLQTSRGRDLVKNLACEIVQICRHEAERVPPPDDLHGKMKSRILAFINDLTINLQTRNQFVPSAIAAFGLELTLEGGAFLAAERYIEICLSQKGTLHVPQAVDLGRAFIDGLFRDTVETQVRGHDAKDLVALYGLLTGWHMGETEVRPSLARLRNSLFKTDTETYTKYLKILAYLGAFRTLSLEWHASIRGGVGKEALTNIYAEVVLASRATPGQQGVFSWPGFTEATGEIPNDPQLDIQQIAAWHDLISSQPTTLKSDQLMPHQTTCSLPRVRVTRQQQQQARRIFDQPEARQVLQRLKDALVQSDLLAASNNGPSTSPCHP